MKFLDPIEPYQFHLFKKKKTSHMSYATGIAEIMGERLTALTLKDGTPLRSVCTALVTPVSEPWLGH